MGAGVDQRLSLCAIMQHPLRETRHAHRHSDTRGEVTGLHVVRFGTSLDTLPLLPLALVRLTLAKRPLR